MNSKTAIRFHSEYLSVLLDSINASVVATNGNFIIEYWNKCAEELFGYKASEVIGKRGASILKFNYLGTDEETARTTLTTEGNWKGNIVYKKQNGTKVLLDASVSIVRNREGKITGYVGIHRDITEYSKVKTDLSTLLSTFSNIDDDFFIVDKDLKVAFINEKLNKSLVSYYGITYNVGDSILEKLPPHRKEQVEKSFRKALKGEKTSYEVRITNTAGRSLWLQENYFPIKERNGAIRHACLIVRDITAQKEIEQVNEQLYRSRKLFETFMENSPILSWITDCNGNIRYLNPAFLKIYHLKKECIGKSLFEVLPHSFAQLFRENDELVLQTNQSLKTVEKGVTPDSREHIYQVVKFPIISDETTYIGGWAIDITEEIRLRESLSASLNRLQHSEKELKTALVKEHQLNNLKSRFVSIASHEFRTPLSTMLSSTFLLEKYTTTEQQINRVKHIRKIKESIEHMNSLLEDFLSLGKLDEGKTTVSTGHVRLSELISDLVEETEIIRKKGQVVHFNGGAIKEICTDKKLLRNILVNLLSNAYKFSEENQGIWITAQQLADKIEISVKDEGIGISKEDQKHLFETFFRAGNVQNIQGTGLGLHIVKRYAELLTGRIQLESKLGEGTIVKLTLPAC